VLKLPLYARSGVRWIWLVEPEARFIEVYESVGERPVRVAGVTDEELAALPPFEGEAPVSAWWLKDV
jgi:hypothetical protein